MTDDSLLPFSFPAVGTKKVAAAFDGGRITSDGGVMLLAMADRRLGVAERLARRFPDRRDPMRITHTLADLIRARCRSRCSVFVERAKPSSSARSSSVNMIGVASGMLFMHP